LDSQIDALLSDASGSDPTGTAEHSHTPPQSAAADAEAAVASIEKQVESLVEQFVEQVEPQVAATTQDSADQSDPLPAPASTADESNLIAPDDASANAAPESIGELDDQLARLTDELLTAPAIEPYQAPSVKFAPTPEDQIEPAPVVMPQVAVAVAAAAITSPVAPTETPTPIAIPVVVATPARPSKLVQAFAKPLAGKPRLVRDTVGWLGFNSMFLAGVVWSYHLWFQKPEKPVAQHAPAALVSSDGHDDPAHGQAAAAGHGAPAAGDAHAGHGAKPEDAHADASHGSDEPITGVRPLHKKKPTYALSDAMAERLNVAKKADAGGHGAEKKSGGGHGAPAKSGH
jgi:hypothetical protein